MSQKGKKGAGKKPSGECSGNQNHPRIQKGIRAKSVPKRSNDK